MRVNITGPLVGDTVMRDGVVLGKVTMVLGRYQRRYWGIVCSDGLSYILGTREQGAGVDWCWNVKPAHTKARKEAHTTHGT